MMDDYQLASFQIISAVGTAKSCFIEAIGLAEKAEFDAASEKMKEGKTAYKNGHEVHFNLLQEEAEGEKQTLNLLLIHAEDQLMSTETIQLLAEKMIDTNKRLYRLEER